MINPGLINDSRSWHGASPFRRHHLFQAKAFYLGNVSCSSLGDWLRNHVNSQWCQTSHQWRVPSMGVPQNGWFIVENPIKTKDFGVPPYIYGKPHIFAQQSWMYILKKPLFLPVLVKPLVMCCFPFKWRNKYVESYQPVIHFFCTGGYLQQTRSSLNRLGDTFIYIYIWIMLVPSPCQRFPVQQPFFPAINILPMCPNPKCTQAAGILCERLRTTVDRLFTVPLWMLWGGDQSSSYPHDIPMTSPE